MILLYTYLDYELREKVFRRLSYLVHPQDNFIKWSAYFGWYATNVFATSLEVEIELRVLHSCRVQLNDHSGFQVLPQVAALLKRHIWAFESLGVYTYNRGLWKLSSSQILEKCSFKFSVSDDGFFLSATALLCVDFMWYQDVLIPLPFPKYSYIMWLVALFLSLSNYIWRSLFFLS